MPGRFHHELLYRGPEIAARLAAARFAICGCGAIGSHLADNLARQGAVHLRAIDHDRIEEHNVSTQLHGESEVGVWKVEALRNRLFRAAGVEIEAVRKELTAANARQLLKDSDLIVDAFDNAGSRQAVQDAARVAGVPCLHVGLYEDYFESVWDAIYRVPANVGIDVCNYPMARNLILLAVAVAGEAIVEFLGDGRQISRSGTLKDFRILTME